MSPFTSKKGVTNPDLTVKGTLGLRIVDLSVLASILPISANRLELIILYIITSLLFPAAILKDLHI